MAFFRTLTLLALLVVVLAPAHSAFADHLSLHGTVWEDKNADGDRQADEPGIAHWPVLLRLPSGQALEATTDINGRFTFGGLDPGDYLLQLEYHAGGSPFLLTHPVSAAEPPYSRPIKLEDSSLAQQDFGLHVPTGLPAFTGMAWVEGLPADLPEVRAYIGDTDCTGPIGVMPPDQDLATYGLTVLSAALKPGCGEPGDTVHFTIDGRPANETAEWQAVPEGEAPLQDGRGRLTLTAGPPFAYLWPLIRHAGADDEVQVPGRAVVALIDGRVCGVGLHRTWGAVLLPVPSEELEPGCGEEGAEVSFAVDGFAVPETVTWRPGELDDFTFEYDPSPEAPQAGPAFAYYTFEIEERPPGFVGLETQHIEAFIGGASCGSARGLGPVSLVVPVAPEELVAGCGDESAQVVFTLNGVAFGEPVAWQPGFQAGPALAPAAPGEAPTDGTPEPGRSRITPPDTGDGGLR